MRTNFYIDKSQKDKKGFSPINFYISYQGKKLKFGTGQKVRPEQWDSEKQRAIPGADKGGLLNDLLDVMAEEPFIIERKARINGIDCSVEYLKSNLTYFKPKATGFFDVFEEFIRIEANKNSWTKGTEKRWNHLKDNLTKFNKFYKVEFNSINQDFSNKFIERQIKNGWGNVTTKKAVSMTVQFVRWAFKNNYHTSTSYRDIEIKIKTARPESNVVYLTIEELLKINQVKFKENETGLETARDVLLFSCFTGLRHSDLLNLKRSFIKNDYIHVPTIKTGDVVKIPLTDPARNILKKYEALPGENPIPVISQQKYNDHLKTIGERAGLNDTVTQVHYKGRERIETTLKKHQIISSHIGRKTFVTLAVFLDIPLETTAKITGHRSDAIQAYYDVLDH